MIKSSRVISVEREKRAECAPCFPCAQVDSVEQKHRAAVVRRVRSRKAGNAAGRQRTGAITLEFLAAAVLLSTVATFLLPFVGRVALMNREASDREWALREVRNIVTLHQSGVQDPQLSLAGSARLPDAELSIQESPAEDQLQRVDVVLTWTNRHHQPARAVRLCYWKPAEDQP